MNLKCLTITINYLPQAIICSGDYRGHSRKIESLQADFLQAYLIQKRSNLPKNPRLISFNWQNQTHFSLKESTKNWNKSNFYNEL